MKIDRILAGIRESQAAEKQASEAPVAPAAEKTASTQTALVTAMKEALTPAEKTASEKAPASPVDDVMKVAEQLAGAEKEAALKEAQILGAAFADAAVARLGDWSKVASQMVATAPAVQAIPGNADFGKFAQQNPELVKQAAQLGYEAAKADLEKQAEDSYVQGYNDTVDTIHKTAALEFLKAASVTAQIVEASVRR
jgi:hypothetical protein